MTQSVITEVSIQALPHKQLEKHNHFPLYSLNVSFSFYQEKKLIYQKYKEAAAILCYQPTEVMGEKYCQLLAETIVYKRILDSCCRRMSWQGGRAAQKLACPIIQAN